MDDFKKYIQQHREQLDIDLPSEDVWSRIEQKLEPKRGLVVPMIIKWAAAACIILLAGFGVYNLIPGNNKYELARVDHAPAMDKTVKQNKVQPEQQDLVGEEQHSVEIKKPVQKETKVFDDDKEENLLARNKKQEQARGEQDNYENPVSKAFNEMEASYASMVNIQLEKIKGTPIYAEDAGYFHVFKKQFQDLNNDEKVLKEETKKNGINDDIITRMISIYQEKITLLKQLQFEINKMNNRAKNSDSEVQNQPPSYINL